MNIVVQEFPHGDLRKIPNSTLKGVPSLKLKTFCEYN